MNQDEAVHVSPASEALERYLDRALRNRKRAHKKLKASRVHDFRVALRRCRTLAEGFSAIDPAPVWRRLRKTSKKLQKSMSDLRDVQVLKKWVKPLKLTSGPTGKALAKHLDRQERRGKREAKKALNSFPRKRWKRWLRQLPETAELIPVNERRLAQLALEQLARVIDLHERWTNHQNPENWHELRVSVKRFRYRVESFLPEKSAAWSTELKRVQDLLGEGHDLDVLRSVVVKLASKKSLPASAVSASLRRLDGAAQKRRNDYVLLISGSPHRNARRAGSFQAHAETPQILWERWRIELEAGVSFNRQAAGAPARSAARRELHATARANRYPHKPRRISSAP